MSESQTSSNLSAAHRRYRCRDGWLSLACRSEAHWQALSKAIGRPELAYPGSWQAASTAPPEGPLAQLLESIFADDAVSVWLRRLRAHGVPASPVASPERSRTGRRRPGSGAGQRV